MNVLPHIDVQPKAGRRPVVQGRHHLSASRQGVRRQQRRRHRRFRRPDREARLSAGSRRHHALAAAVLSVPRHATTATTSPTTAASIPTSARMRDFRRFMHGGAAPRPARHHRARHQPHLRPASLVQAGARAAAPDTDARNWYVWSDTDQKYAGTRIIFTDTEKSNWTWDPDAKRLLLAPLLLAPARPQLRQSARALGAWSR